MTSAAILINYNDKDNAIRMAMELQSYKLFNKVLIVDNCSPNEEEYNEIVKAVSSHAVINRQAYLIELSQSRGVLGSTIIEVVKTDHNGGYNYAINYGVHYLEAQAENYDIYMVANTDISISIKAVKECMEELVKYPSTAVCAPRMKNAKGVFARRDCWKERTLGGDYENRILLWSIRYIKSSRFKKFR